MPISPGTHPDSSPYSSTNILPRYRKHEWGLVPYTLTIWLGNKSQEQLASNSCLTMQPNTDFWLLRLGRQERFKTEKSTQQLIHFTCDTKGESKFMAALPRQRIANLIHLKNIWKSNSKYNRETGNKNNSIWNKWLQAMNLFKKGMH